MVSATGPLARVGRVVVLLTQPILKGSRGPQSCHPGKWEFWLLLPKLHPRLANGL